MSAGAFTRPGSHCLLLLSLIQNKLERSEEAHQSLRARLAELSDTVATLTSENEQLRLKEQRQHAQLRDLEASTAMLDPSVATLLDEEARLSASLREENLRHAPGPRCGCSPFPPSTLTTDPPCGLGGGGVLRGCLDRLQGQITELQRQALQVRAGKPRPAATAAVP